MRARADARLAIVVVATLVAAPTVVWAAKSDPPSAARAQQILEQNRPLAKNGDASAQYNMGVLYDRGYGVERDYAKARQWYEKAAAQHYARAEHNLGIMYEAGKGVPRDLDKAAHWFRRGADDGQTASQNNLAVLYMKGEGVPQNTGKAAFWAARAAAGGNSAAIDNLPRIITDLPHIHMNADDVNVRDQPDRGARVVGHADSDSVAVVLSRRDDWTQILLPDNYTLGWVANFLLSDSQAPLAGNKMPKPDTAKAAPDSGSRVQAVNAAPYSSEPSEGRTAAPSSQPPATPPKHAPGEGFSADHRTQAGPLTAPKEAAPKTSPDQSVPSPAAAPEHNGGSEPEASRKAAGAASGGKGHKPEPSAPAASTAPETKPASRKQPPEKTETTTDETAAAAKPAPARTSAATHATVGVDAINLRAKAGSGGRVIGQLHRGDRVQLLDQHNGWRYVRTAGGMKGWVAGYLLVMP
ncbi:MAG: SH3 domain-containing protein [Salinisphaera sp.]|uniref:SH3 domain-containing protein n=1 Tax=Salinisphaera sp. TaxID=1914330 RepID=UPI003C799352